MINFVVQKPFLIISKCKMSNTLNKSKVKYVGIDDPDLKIFENQYKLEKGMAYNSYLILDEKTALLDTVDIRVGEKWKPLLLEALEGRTLDYLIVQHLEPDHSALVKWVVDTFPEITVVASAKALSMLPQFFENFALAEGKSIAVKDGDALELGEHKLEFCTAAMVHWPEVIMTLDSSEGTLYSADAFGKFGALSICGYDDEQEQDWLPEARRYYLNIVGKYGAPVQGVLRKLAGKNINKICPLHGPILTKELGKYIELYSKWSSYLPEEDGVFIACASIHGNTWKVAQKAAEDLEKRGVKVKLSDLCNSDIAENVAQAFRFSRMILCASSYDAQLFTPMYDFLHRLQIKTYQRRKVAIVENGSWAPSAARIMIEMCAEMKNVDIVDPVLSIRSSFKPENQQVYEELLDKILL